MVLVQKLFLCCYPIMKQLLISIEKEKKNYCFGGEGGRVCLRVEGLFLESNFFKLRNLSNLVYQTNVQIFFLFPFDLQTNMKIFMLFRFVCYSRTVWICALYPPLNNRCMHLTITDMLTRTHLFLYLTRERVVVSEPETDCREAEVVSR